MVTTPLTILGIASEKFRRRIVTTSLSSNLMTFALMVGSIGVGMACPSTRLSSSVALAGYKQQSAEHPTQLESNPNENLSGVAQKLITVIEEGEESKLAEFWSQSGVSFGVEGAVVGKRALLRQLHQKMDTYCFFFDTECLRKQDDAQRRAAKAPPRKNTLYSYRELIRGASSKEVKVSEYNDHGVLLGRVLVNLTMNEKIPGVRQRVLEFTFAKENEKWKLTSVPYN